MVKQLVGTFSRIQKTKVMIIGDIVLDTYTIGKAQRISPEAPVAVVKVHHEEYRPGMAGNVALNLISLGTKVVLVGRVGDDTAGGLLRRSLEEEGVDTAGLLVQKGFCTPVKNRIIAENQQVVRVDREETSPISAELEREFLAKLPALLQDVRVVALSDYAKGLFSTSLLRAIIDLVRSKEIPIIADPKGRDFTRYSGVTLIKPNLGEALAAANLDPGASLEQVAGQVLQSCDAQVLMVTRSEAGISLFFRNGQRSDFPVKARQVKDVTGAGDTVLATLACAMASQLSLDEAAQLCNVAAGIAIERFGCARVSLSDLAKRLLESDLTSKIFDEEHLFALQEVLADRRVTVLGIDSATGLSAHLFGIIRSLAKREGGALLLYLREAHPNEHFLDLLLSLREVDFVIRKGEGLRHLCTAIRPAEVFVVEGGQLKRLEHGLELLHV